MNLAQALAVQPGDVVAFVGAGGKTHAMFRLASELVAQGLRVLTTTTTRIAQSELSHAPYTEALGESIRPPEMLSSLLEQHRHVFLFTRLEDRQRKVRGMPPAWLDENLVGYPGVDVLLVESDGSRRLPMKAPLPHEPAVPLSANVVVPVIGLDVLGKPLDEKHVYGADHIRKLTGHPLDVPVTPALVAAALMHPRLSLKGVPPGARIMPLLNKVTAKTLPQAQDIARRVLTDLNIERVLIGAVKENDPVWEVRRRVGAIILGAGQSRRMGQPKLLMPWGDGLTMIRQVCQQVAASGLHEIVVVAGEEREAIRQQVEGLPARVVYNPDYAESEMLSSLKVGLAAIWYTSDACLVVLGDQPSIQQTVIADLLQAYAQGRGRIVAPTYYGQRGHPVIFDRTLWSAILDLPSSAAPRDVFRVNPDEVYHLAVETDSVLRDIDTPDDYRREHSRWESPNPG